MWQWVRVGVRVSRVRVRDSKVELGLIELRFTVRVRVWLGHLPISSSRKFQAKIKNKTRMWANAQRDDRPAEYRWCPLFNTAKFG